MILVLLGTQDKPFLRLLKMVSKEIDKGNIKEKVVAQTGYTAFSDKNMESFDFKNKEEIEKLIDKARIIITHAGVDNNGVPRKRKKDNRCTKIKKIPGAHK